MKKPYQAPALELELYELNASIASNCSVVVTNGPKVGNHELCDDYVDPFDTQTQRVTTFSGPYNVQFYEDTNCDCYYSSSDNGYWTS